MNRRSDIDFGVVTLLGNDDVQRHYGISEIGGSSSSSISSSTSCTRMVGRFPRLSSLSHPNLCSYIQLIRSTTVDNAVFLVSEHYKMSLADYLQKSRLTVEQILLISRSLISAINYLHNSNIVLGYFSLSSVFFCEGTIQLGQYGLYWISGGGTDIDGCVASPWYISPERLQALLFKRDFVLRSSDVWAFGIGLFELLVGVTLSEIWGIKQIFAVIATSFRKAVNGSSLHPLLEAVRIARPNVDINIQSELYILLEKILFIQPSKRPKAKEILKCLDTILESCGGSNDASIKTDNILSANCKKNYDLQVSDLKEQLNGCFENFCGFRSPKESFYLWTLSGSSVENILLNHGIIRANSPVNMLPHVVFGDCCMFGNDSSRRCCFTNFRIFQLPTSNLRERLQNIEKKQFVVSFELQKDLNAKSELSLIVKEKDIEYQARRMLVLSHLIEAYPFKQNLLREECAIDVPPLHRGSVWAMLLNVTSCTEERFLLLDTFQDHPSDRQLMVDIPRCHQYDELMASPTAHFKLKRILKAWLVAHPNYVYWQGLDSLAAPFLVLNFTNLLLIAARAFSCLDSFIAMYLHNFFLQDNSPVIQEYLTVFYHLLAFVDAELYTYLTNMDFFPELFAIPWFLTCFAHVLPLHKLFHVWDVLLLLDSSFPLFVGLAIMEQLRQRLISASFNDAILLFSDLPDLNIERIVQESQAIYSFVPPSCTFRSHASTHLREPILLKPYSIDLLKQCHCPRISAEDFIRLFDRSLCLIIDIRTQQEFSHGSLTGSINYPYGDNEPLDMILTALRYAQLAEHVIVIVDNQLCQRAFLVAERCVLSGFNRLCVLDGGIECLRSKQHRFQCSF
uniref:TBC domain-containing protein kinase-like protein n=1 Tax=Syphacia muris TaxID=451379 RepID=A0A0N5AET7_9BILA